MNVAKSDLQVDIKRSNLLVLWNTNFWVQFFFFLFVCVQIRKSPQIRHIQWRKWLTLDENKRKHLQENISNKLVYAAEALKHSEPSQLPLFTLAGLPVRLTDNDSSHYLGSYCASDIVLSPVHTWSLKQPYAMTIMNITPSLYRWVKWV